MVPSVVGMTKNYAVTNFGKFLKVEVKEENKEQLYEIGIKMMSMLKLTGVAVCLYAGISGNLSPAPMWPVWILIGGCFGIVIWGIRAMKKAGKDQ